MTFLKSIISKESPNSSKRLITLIVSGLFILAQIDILFMINYVVFYTPKGQVNKDLLNFLSEIMEYDFILISLGLGFTTVENGFQFLTEKYKAKAAAINNVIEQAVTTNEIT